jgi:hypothetical protein
MKSPAEYLRKDVKIKKYDGKYFPCVGDVVLTPSFSIEHVPYDKSLHFLHGKESSEEVKHWIKRYCASKEDIVLDKKVLEIIAECEEEESYKNIMTMVVCQLYTKSKMRLN